MGLGAHRFFGVFSVHILADKGELGKRRPVEGERKRAVEMPPPASPASCLFPVQTALLAKPLLPHHDPPTHPPTPALAPYLLFRSSHCVALRLLPSLSIQ